VVDVDGTGQSLNIGRMEELFSIAAFRPSNIYELMGDGERLLVNERLTDMEASMIIVIQNWALGLSE